MSKLSLRELDKFVIFGFVRTNSNLKSKVIVKLIHLFVFYKKRQKVIDFAAMYLNVIKPFHKYRIKKGI